MRDPPYSMRYSTPHPPTHPQQPGRRECHVAHPATQRRGRHTTPAVAVTVSERSRADRRAHIRGAAAVAARLGCSRRCCCGPRHVCRVPSIHGVLHRDHHLHGDSAVGLGHTAAAAAGRGAAEVQHAMHFDKGIAVLLILCSRWPGRNSGGQNDNLGQKHGRYSPHTMETHPCPGAGGPPQPSPAR